MDLICIALSTEGGPCMVIMVVHWGPSSLSLSLSFVGVYLFDPLVDQSKDGAVREHIDQIVTPQVLFE